MVRPLHCNPEFGWHCSVDFRSPICGSLVARSANPSCTHSRVHSARLCPRVFSRLYLSRSNVNQCKFESNPSHPQESTSHHLSCEDHRSGRWRADVSAILALSGLVLGLFVWYPSYNLLTLDSSSGFGYSFPVIYCAKDGSSLSSVRTELWAQIT